MLAVLQFVFFANVNGQRTINVDFNKSSGKLNAMYYTCVGAGRANEGLRADWQQQLEYVRKQCGFKMWLSRQFMLLISKVYKQY